LFYRGKHGTLTLQPSHKSRCSSGVMDRDANVQNRWEQTGGFRSNQYNAHIQNHYHGSSSQPSVIIWLSALLITPYREQ
jgi:hypothetical protein